MVKIKETSRKTNIFLLTFCAILIVITILCALFPDFGDAFSIGNWFNLNALENVPFWAAVGFVMLACFLGALVPVPIPYALPISLFAIVWVDSMGALAWGYIILLVCFATLANTMGDMIDYLIGKGTQQLLSQEDPELQNRWSQIILKKPEAIPGVIVLFGLTPLPDSLLMVPLGIVEYDMKKTIFWMMVGRFGMFMMFALAGVFALDWFLDIVAGESSEFGWIIGVAILWLIFMIIVCMVKITPETESEKKLKSE